MNTVGAEAQRWLSVAERLLAARDFHSAKTFAIRAREADPRSDFADRVLVIADTILAGDSKINDSLPDYYALLQVSRFTQNIELIATQYRKLALFLDPNVNKLAFSDQALRLVIDAWNVLSSPAKKAMYDSQLALHSTPTRPSRTNESQQLQQRDSNPQHQQQKRPSRKNRRHNECEFGEEGGRPSFGDESGSQQPSFWTACPYCYVLYEYSREYAECTLRCHNCKRAFQAVTIPAPLQNGENKYFCCWGFFPLAISGNLKNAQGFSGWSPISPMFACPIQGDGKQKNDDKQAPRFYFDDNDVFVEVSDPSDDSDQDDDDDDDDDDWDMSSERQGVKSAKGKSPAGKNTKNSPLKRVRKGNQSNLASGGNLDSGSKVKVSNSSNGESSRVGLGSGGKKQTGRGIKGWGRLDLNVEFSNEVEEPASAAVHRSEARNGEDDNIEGTEFFEGLDEFLSTLPILNVEK